MNVALILNAFPVGTVEILDAVSVDRWIVVLNMDLFVHLKRNLFFSIYKHIYTDIFFPPL